MPTLRWTLVSEGFGGFYSSTELTFVSWWRGSFLIGKTLLNTSILWDFFSLLGFPWLGLIMGYKIFPFMDVCGGQAKRCWTRHALCSRWPLTSRRPITPLEDFCRLHVYAVGYQGEVVGLGRLFRMSSHVGEVDGPNGAVSFLVCNVFIKYPRQL